MPSDVLSASSLPSTDAIGLYGVIAAIGVGFLTIYAGYRRDKPEGGDEHEAQAAAQTQAYVVTLIKEREAADTRYAELENKYDDLRDLVDTLREEIARLRGQIHTPRTHE